MKKSVASIMSRGEFLRRAGAGAGVVAASAVLAACGTQALGGGSRGPTTVPAAPDTVRRSGGSPEPEMVRIAGGEYTIGTDYGPSDERPVHAVALAPFFIDRREVTNGQFVEYLNSLSVRPLGDAYPGEMGDGVFRPPDEELFFEGPEGSESPRLIVALDDENSRIGVRDGRFAVLEGYEDHPIAETSWRGARDFAEWRGARLPTEVEWEAAARGSEGRTYPWGEAPVTEERAVIGTYEPERVGTRPAGATPEGATDMAGNLAEWTSSLYRPYPYDPDDGREDPNDPGERVTRGGDAYFSGEDDLRGAARTGFSRVPGRGHRHIGFRCARSA